MTPLTQCRDEFIRSLHRLIAHAEAGKGTDITGPLLIKVNDCHGDMQACEFDGRQDDLQRAEKMAGRVC